MLPPSQKALVPVISVDHMMQLINHIGLEQMLTGLAIATEDDFKRWQSFDKTPRIASHSAEGMIELMPTADETAHEFKYVNGHPKLPTADCKPSPPLACWPMSKPAILSF